MVMTEDDREEANGRESMNNQLENHTTPSYHFFNHEDRCI